MLNTYGIVNMYVKKREEEISRNLKDYQMIMVLVRWNGNGKERERGKSKRQRKNDNIMGVRRDIRWKIEESR